MANVMENGSSSSCSVSAMTLDTYFDLFDALTKQSQEPTGKHAAFAIVQPVSIVGGQRKWLPIFDPVITHLTRGHCTIICRGGLLSQQ